MAQAVSRWPLTAEARVVGFVVDKVALGQVFLRVLRFSPANIIPPLLHIHLSLPHEVCDSSDQAAHYHHLGPKLRYRLLDEV
jgi:branched-subunit amino acid transport protein